jgi:glycosyltransferase involved in cell wall biosynthesis
MSKKKKTKPKPKSKRLKVCVISTTVMVCPPPGYSGLEMIAWLQARGLARRGYDVLLIAPVGSTPPDGVELHGTTVGEGEKQAYSGYWQRLPEFDVIIDNSWEKWSYMLKIEGKLGAPILGVIHAPANTMYGVAPPVLHPCFVSISDDQGVGAMESWGIPTRTAHNGVDMEFYKAKKGAKRNDRYLFLARMSRIKGPQIAVDVARKLRIGLDLVGDDKLTGEPQLAQRMQMQAKHNIKYWGGVSRERAVEFFSENKALLHMNLLFREPFGLAPVEAQLCGMPVIAYDNGAMRETINPGVTGFLVKSQEEVEELVKTDAVASIKPSDCIEWAARFSVKNMVDRYENLVHEAIETGGW